MDHGFSHAERCRALVAAARSATLSTVARDPEGYPYGSLVAVAADALGRPLLLLSTLAEHTQNLKVRPDASVLVTEAASTGATGVDPLAGGRVTLLGPCAPVPESEQAAVREAYLAAVPSAAQYVDFPDFAFHRLEPVAVRYIAGFGRMSWVSAEAYRAGRP